MAERAPGANASISTFQHWTSLEQSPSRSLRTHFVSQSSSSSRVGAHRPIRFETRLSRKRHCLFESQQLEGRSSPAHKRYVCLKVVRKPKSYGQQILELNIGAVKLLRRDGVWWEVKLQRYPNEPELQYDVWLERPLVRLTLDECKFVYGEKSFAISKRQLTQREFKRQKRELEKRQAKNARRRISR